MLRMVLSVCLGLTLTVHAQDIPAFDERPPAIDESVSLLSLQSRSQDPLVLSSFSVLTDPSLCNEAYNEQQTAEVMGTPLSDSAMQKIANCHQATTVRVQALRETLRRLGYGSAGDLADRPIATLWKSGRETVTIGTAAAALGISHCVNAAAVTEVTNDRDYRVCASEVRDALANRASLLFAGALASTGATSTAAAAAALPRSWESIVIDALANQMVVQIRGVAAQKLLALFGNTLCDKRGNTDLRSYFPDTCSLLTADPTQPVRVQVTQLPAEFQRTLRNDLVSLLPAVIQMGRINDNAVQAVVPILLAARNGDPLVEVAKFQCTPAIDSPADARACAILNWTAAAVSSWQQCASASDPATCAAAALLKHSAFRAWATANPSLAVAVESKLPRFYEDVATIAAQYREISQPDAIAKSMAALAVSRAVLMTLNDPAFGDADAIAKRAAQLVKLQRLESKTERWGSLARVVYRVAEGFRKGYDPLALSVEAASDAGCISDDDIGCSVRLAGITFKHVRSACETYKADLSGGGDQLAVLRAIASEVRTKIAADPGVTGSSFVKAIWTQRIDPRFDSWSAEVLPAAVDVFRGFHQAQSIVKDKNLKPSERDAALNELYAQMIDGTFDVWRLSAASAVAPERRERVVRLVNNARVCWRAAKERNYLILTGALYSLAIDTGIGRPLPDEADQYRRLLTNLAAAQDEAGLKEAVNDYLADNTNSISKFDSQYAITLTGLPGLSAASLSGGSSVEPALYAPVGIDIFAPKLFRFPAAIYVSLLDLGNLVSSRYKSDNDQELETSTRFRDVFAPGVYIRFPLRQSGFSTGVGFARTPVSITGTNETKYSAKTSVFFAYDLNWFTFWRRSR